MLPMRRPVPRLARRHLLRVRSHRTLMSHLIHAARAARHRAARATQAIGLHHPLTRLLLAAAALAAAQAWEAGHRVTDIHPRPRRKRT